MSAPSATVREIGSQAAFDDAISTFGEAGVVIMFWAGFEETSKPGGDMDVVFTRLASLYADKCFARVDAELFPNLTEKYAIDLAPTFVVIARGAVAGKCDGADPAALAALVSKTLGGAGSGTVASPVAADDAALQARLRRLTTASRVMLFMKGTPSGPRCKFSRAIVELLAPFKVQYGSFDILTDNDVRQGLKTFGNWPTFPQLYVDGELAGGLDVIKALHADGELEPLLKPAGAGAAGAGESLEDRLKALVKKARVMLFMKGSPDAPRCGFSAKIVSLLQAEGFEFGTFDILSDDDVRQGLKTFSNWPTFPQLYIDGELVGGLDVVEALRDEGELAAMRT